MICRENESKQLYNYEFSEDGTIVKLFDKENELQKEIEYSQWLKDFYVVAKFKSL